MKEINLNRNSIKEYTEFLINSEQSRHYIFSINNSIYEVYKYPDREIVIWRYTENISDYREIFIKHNSGSYKKIDEFISNKVTGSDGVPDYYLDEMINCMIRNEPVITIINKHLFPLWFIHKYIHAKLTI